jgi:S1/P1 Nuclease
VARTSAAGGAELADPQTDAEERIAALKFLLHFVGDLHQPLHSADDNDRGGNDKRASVDGFNAGNLHSYRDTQFVVSLGEDAKTVASDLVGHITKARVSCAFLCPILPVRYSPKSCTWR